MSFLVAIEKSKGEQLVSNAFEFLLKSDEIYRNAVLHLLHTKYAASIELCCENLRTKREHFTKVSTDQGFVDVILDTETHLVVIEIKLNADFQDKQPSKYEMALREVIRAGDVDAIFNDVPNRSQSSLANNGSQKELIVVVICPEFRLKEVHSYLNLLYLSSQKPAVLTWEEILGIECKSGALLKPETLSIVSMLQEYMNVTGLAMAQIAKDPSIFYGPFKGRDSLRFQSNLLENLFREIFNPILKVDRKLSTSSPYYIGYLIGLDITSPKCSSGYAHIGFAKKELFPSSDLHSGSQSSVFYLVTSFPISWPDDAMKYVRKSLYKNPDTWAPSLIGPHSEFYWTIEVDQHLSSTESWRQLLLPLTRELSRLIGP